MKHSFVLAALILIPWAPLNARQHSEIRGHVLKPDATPLAGARVSIATAAVRRGTSPY